MMNKYDTHLKITKVINSCTTKSHCIVAKCMLNRFSIMHKNAGILITGLWIALVDKEVSIRLKRKPHT
jgi:hypothetical protein